MEIINYVISIGPLCHTSYNLNQMGLKKFSCPFDWIFSNLTIVQNCIENKFRYFLDKKYYYVSQHEIARYIGHQYYSHASIFAHHDPLENIDHYNYFCRCVERFIKVLASDKNKLFVYTDMGYYEKEDMNENHALIKNYVQFDNFLKLHTSYYKLLFIIMNNSKSHPKSQATKILENDNISIYFLENKSISNGLTFSDPIDNITYQNIIKNYQFDLIEQI